MTLKKSFFMKGSDTVLPTPLVRALSASVAGALATDGNGSQGLIGPVGETGAGAVAVSVIAPAKRADAPSPQPLFARVAP